MIAQSRLILMFDTMIISSLRIKNNQLFEIIYDTCQCNNHKKGHSNSYSLIRKYGYNLWYWRIGSLLGILSLLENLTKPINNTLGVLFYREAKCKQSHKIHSTQRDNRKSRNSHFVRF